MSLSTAKWTRALKALRARRGALRQQLSRPEPIVTGNVYDVLRRCGNPSCHCALKPGHRQTLLIYVDKGRRRCKYVRRQDAAWVKRAWQRYRDCRKALGKIRTLNQRELRLLRVRMQQRRINYNPDRAGSRPPGLGR